MLESKIFASSKTKANCEDHTKSESKKVKKVPNKKYELCLRLI